ncbi:RNA-binding protein 1-like [Chenopodium quinoa]|uniref:RNA-binding protein 1-like n=1 Tax=Chenopodium quinoa TaxID=63459 RepID=UPI000B76EA4E|nr:RNA-binding protein 1-like [Chenopodium quinoa]
MAHHMLRPNDLRDSSIDPLGRDVVPLRSRAYGLDDISGFSARSEPALGGLTAGMSARGYTSSLEDPILFSQRRDVPLGISPVPPGNPDIIYERPNSQRRVESLSLHETESNILFVDGLPTDCTRREVGHIFRPFIGFKDIKVIHKEARRSGEKAMVLCFVEFNDSKCALTAMEALNGYKFDDKKPESSILRIHFAHFPFRLPSQT